MRAVLDTNVLVAAFAAEGICSKILTRGRKKQFHLIACPIILQEFERVLIKKFSATRNEARSALQIVSEAMHRIVQPSQSEQGVCRDPDDDWVSSTKKFHFKITQSVEKSWGVIPKKFGLSFVKEEDYGENYCYLSQPAVWEY